jgi:hypothetical protein
MDKEIIMEEKKEFTDAELLKKIRLRCKELRIEHKQEKTDDTERISKEME